MSHFELPNQLTDVHLEVDVLFGSSAADHRKRLRSAIKAYIQRQDPGVSVEQLSVLDDFSKPPQIDGWALSISHCPPLGGFALKRSASALGLDFEIASRVSQPIAQRIAAFPKEQTFIAELDRMRSTGAAVPWGYAAIWVSKESAIKAFGNRDPELNAHFGVVEIKDFDFKNFHFSASCNGASADGQVFAANEEVIGAFAEIKS